MVEFKFGFMFALHHHPIMTQLTLSTVIDPTQPSFLHPINAHYLQLVLSKVQFKHNCLKELSHSHLLRMAGALRESTKRTVAAWLRLTSGSQEAPGSPTRWERAADPRLDENGRRWLARVGAGAFGAGFRAGIGPAQAPSAVGG